MKIPRFYQTTNMTIGDEIDLSPENHRHAIQVLRLKINEPLVLFNSEGGEYLASITLADKRKSRILIQSFEDTNRESPLSITLALSTIKPDKMNFAIQKAVELGISTIQPMYTKRSVINIKANRLEKKMNHWQGIIIAACEQSGRTKIPVLCEPQSLEKCLDDYSNNTCITMLPNAKKKIAELSTPDIDRRIVLFVGPEGGFTDEEELQMLNYSLTAVNFGSRILRAETAVIAGITSLQLAWGDL